MTAFYLGPLGRLRPVPLVQRGASAQVSRASSSLVTLGGARHIQSAPRGPRDWSLSLGARRDASLVAHLAACATGALPGPLYLYARDAARTNLLPADVAAPCQAGTSALGSAAGSVPVGMPSGAEVLTGVTQQATAGAWSATIPVRSQVGYVLSGWGSAAGALIEWRSVSAGGVPVASGTLSAVAVEGGFYGAVELSSGTAAGLQVRLAAGSRTVGGLRLVEGMLPTSGAVLATNLATNPSFEATSGTVEVRRNLRVRPQTTATLPVLTAGTSVPWGGTAPTLTQVADSSAPSGGGYATRATSPVSQTCVAGGDALLGGAGIVAVTVGETYTLSVYVRASVALTVRVQAQWLTAASASVGFTNGADVTLAPGVWTRVWVTGVAPGTAASVRTDVDFVTAQSLPAGMTLDADGLLGEASPVLGPYFDGSTSPDSDLTPSWTGTANASESVLTGVGVEGAPTNAWSFALSSQQWAGAGSRSVRLVPRGTDGSTNTYTDLGGGPGGLRYGMTGGKTYTILATYRLAAPQTGPLNSMARRVAVYHRTGGSYTALPSPAAMSPNVAGVHQIRYTVTLPAGTTEAFPRLFNGAAVGGGDVWWDNLAIIEGNYTGEWFDGSNPPAGTYATWDGAPNASSSTERILPDDATWPGWVPGRGVPQVVVDDPAETLQLVTSREVLADYAVTIREVG